MNILIIGKFDKESFGSHIAQTLQSMGHTTINYTKGVKYWHFKTASLNRLNSLKVAGYRLLQNSAKFQEFEYKSLSRTIDTNENGSIDLIISTHDFLTPREVLLLKTKTKAPLCLWFPDHFGTFGRAMFLDSGYDFLFFKDPYIVHILNRELTKKIYYMPECCNPIVHKKYPLTEEDKKKYCCDITTAGNFYAVRSAFYKQFLKYDFDIKIWGNPPPLWMKTKKISRFIQGEYVTHESKGKAFQLSKVVLNNLNPAEVWGLNCRAFEIPAVAGFQLISWRPGLDSIFEDGKEVVSYQSFDDLIEKLNFYLENEEARLEIIENGYSKVHKEHTYQIRLERLLDVVFNNSSGYYNKLNFKPYENWEI